MAYLKPTESQLALLTFIADFIEYHGHSPTLRECQDGLNLNSISQVQSRAVILRDKGYLTWKEGKKRTFQVVSGLAGIPVLGHIFAGDLSETFEDEVEREDISLTLDSPDVYGLRVRGDSMIEAQIQDGDLVIMGPPPELESIADGTIVAARVPEVGKTLKYFYRKNRTSKLLPSSRIILRPANPDYREIEVSAKDLILEGIYIALWRVA